jgi:hypothetical protein
MRLPTEAEWGNYQADLDQSYAHKMFGGRTNQEMIPHFQRNVIERTDELRWMPPIPFRYYFTTIFRKSSTMLGLPIRRFSRSTASST